MRYRRTTFGLSLLALGLMLRAGAGAEEQGPNAVRLANPVAAQPLEQLSAMLERPLFSPGRRRTPAPPPVAQAPAPADLPSPPPNLVLFGVVMDGESARAVVRAGADKRLLRAQMGDEIEGWKVAQIDGRKVVLASQDGRFATYRLFSEERGGADANAASDGLKNSQSRQISPPAAGQEPGQQKKSR